MPEGTTTPPADDAGTPAPGENWEQRYKGLQAVLAKRDAELAARSSDLDTLRSEHETAQTELAAYRQRDVDTSEEELARQQYEQLRQRFEPEPPTPIRGGNRGTGGWEEGGGARFATRERTGNAQGWPT